MVVVMRYKVPAKQRGRLRREGGLSLFFDFLNDGDVGVVKCRDYTNISS